MSRYPMALVVLLVAGLLAGCGGGEVAYTEVKSAPPALPIPQDQGEAAATDVNASDTDASDGVTTKKTDGSTDTSTSTGTTTTPSTSTGTTTAPSTSTGTTTAPTTPSTGTGGSTTGGATPTTPTTGGGGGSSGGSGTGGASPDGSDQFCADNPGACNGN